MAKRLMLTVWWFTIEDLPLLPFKSHHWTNLMGLNFWRLPCWIHSKIYFSNEIMNIFVLNTPFEVISFSDHSGQCISEFCFWFCGKWVYVDDLWSYKMSKCHLRKFVTHLQENLSVEWPKAHICNVNLSVEFTWPYGFATLIPALPTGRIYKSHLYTNRLS